MGNRANQALDLELVLRRSTEDQRTGVLGEQLKVNLGDRLFFEIAFGVVSEVFFS